MSALERLIEDYEAACAFANLKEGFDRSTGENAMIQAARAESAQLRAVNRELVSALESYADCCDGCTCGDGWSHDAAKDALARAKEMKPAQATEEQR